MAEIRVESKSVNDPIFSSDTGYDHLYLGFVDNDGSEFVIGGGPANDNPMDFGPITIEVGSDMDPTTTEDFRPNTSEARAIRGSTVLDLGGRDASAVWAAAGTTLSMPASAATCWLVVPTRRQS